MVARRQRFGHERASVSEKLIDHKLIDFIFLSVNTNLIISTMSTNAEKQENVLRELLRQTQEKMKQNPEEMEALSMELTEIKRKLQARCKHQWKGVVRDVGCGEEGKLCVKCEKSVYGDWLC